MPTKKRQAHKAPGQNVFTLANGMKLRVKPMPAMLLQRAASRVPAPEVPIYIDERTGTEKENPTSPKYQAALQEYQVQQSAVMLFAALSLGTELLDENDEVVDHPPDDGWKDVIKFIGDIDWRKPTYLHQIDQEVDVQMPEEWAEKCAYLIYYALTADDLTTLFEILVGSEGYADALANFQGDDVGDAD